MTSYIFIHIKFTRHLYHRDLIWGTLSNEREAPVQSPTEPLVAELQ